MRCPKCGEDNPNEAVMCWACYTPLSSSSYTASLVKRAGAWITQVGGAILLITLAAYEWKKQSWWGLGCAVLGGAVLGHSWRASRIGFSAPQFHFDEKPPSSKLEEDENETGEERLGLQELVHLSEDVERSEEEPIIRIVNTILLYGFKDGASEIQIEPQQQGSKILYRIDNEWREQMKLPPYIHKPLAQRLKIMADIDILRRRQILEGQTSVRFHDQCYTLYVRTDPQEFGERVTIVIKAMD